MYKEVEAKTLLTRCKSPQSWFGVMYNMNIYRGCEHQCIYCDSRSECYRIEEFSDVIIKTNAVELLKKELSSKRLRGVVGTGSMSDPYTMAEKKYNLTGKALEVIAERRFPVHITTKSNLILKDVSALQEINKVHASVAITVTTSDDALSKKLEPFSPLPSQRLEALGILSELGIYTGITMMPILPFIEDSEDNIAEIVKKAHKYGAKYIVPAFGVTLRDRQRKYYYEKLDISFPGVREKYEKRFGDRYSCSSSKREKLIKVFSSLCQEYNIITSMRRASYSLPVINQMSLFD